MRLDPQSEREIVIWTRRNQMVREMYFLENTVYRNMQSKISENTKQPCMVKSCTTKTRSKTGLCPPHQREAQNL